LAEEQLLARGWVEAAMLEVWRAEAVREVEETVATVQREPGPDPYKENWCAYSCKHLSEGFDEV
jgi:hypothetical protein